MKKNLLGVYAKSNWCCDYFGRGKNSNSKNRHRRALKKSALNRMFKDLDKN